MPRTQPISARYPLSRALAFSVVVGAVGLAAIGGASPAGAEEGESARTTIQIGVDAHGNPAARSTLIGLTCGSESSVFDVGYGRHRVVEVPTDAGPCRLSHVEPAALAGTLSEFDGAGWIHHDLREIAFDPNERSYFWVFDFYPSPWTDLGLFVEQTYLDVAERQPTSSELVRATDELGSGADVAQVALGVMDEAGHYTDSVERVARLYRAFFLRSPDDGGLRYWVDLHRSGLALADIAEQFALSEEFENTYGSVDDARYVDLVYRHVLDRLPDPAGHAYWTGLMRAGLTRGGVMSWFSEGDEFGSAVNAGIIIDYSVETFLRRPAELGDHEALAADARYGREWLVFRVLSSGFYFDRFWYEPEEYVLSRSATQSCVGCGPGRPTPPIPMLAAR